MTIPLWLILGAIMALAIIVAVVMHLCADKGGRNMCDFGDPFLGFILPVFVVMAGVVLSLAVWIVALYTGGS